MTKRTYITIKEVEDIVGIGFDDEGLLILSLDDVNEIIDWYLLNQRDKLRKDLANLKSEEDYCHKLRHQPRKTKRLAT